MVGRRAGCVGALLLLVSMTGQLGVTRPARADVSVTPAAPQAIRRGVRFRFAAERELEGLRLRVWASSADGRPHWLPTQALTVSGAKRCLDQLGGAFRENRAGLDAPDGVVTVAPGATVKLADRLIDRPSRAGRSCTFTYRIELPYLDSALLADPVIAEVVLTLSSRGPDTLVVRPRD